MSVLDWLKQQASTIQQTLGDEMTRYKNRELMEGVVAGCAVVGYANGEVSSAEKQKIKHYDGLGESQLRRNFENVRHKGGDMGVMLLQLCERRLDNVIRRAVFTKTRPQARQGITHGHFQVNGVKVTKPSYLLRPGDVITVRNRENLLTAYRGLCDQSQGERLEWVTFDPDTLRATVQGNPGPSDISLPVDVNMVVEFLSR